VPEPGLAWSALSGLREQTGLVPVLLNGEENDEDYFFQPADVAEIDQLRAAVVLATLWEPDSRYEDTGDVAPLWDAPLSRRFLGLDQPPPAEHSMEDIVRAVIRTMADPSATAQLNWQNEIGRHNAVPLPVQPGEPGRRDQAKPFPGLAPRTDGRLSQAERDTVLASLRPARVGLVPAQRAADVPAIVGWSTFGVEWD
jgi:hypothetical protein